MGFFNGEPLESQGSFISRLLIQLIIILTLPRVLHWLILKRFWQPRVVSEIFSGIILGPSVMGLIPGFTDNIFPPRSIPYLNSLAQIGMILFLFMVGLGLDLEKIWRSRKITIISCFLGLGLPLCLAPALALAFLKPEYTNANFQELLLLITIMLMITALALLARILADRKLFVSNLGSVTMSTTAVDTFLGWVLFAIVLALYGSRVPWVPPESQCEGQVVVTPNDANSSLDPIYIVLCYFGLVLVVIFPIRMLFRKIAERVRHKGHMEIWVFFFSIIVCFGVSWVTQTLTLSGMFGAFTLGTLGIPRIGTLASELRRALDFVVVIILLPVFFCLSGLRTDWTLLDGEAVLLAFLLLFGVYSTKLISSFFSSFVFGMRLFDAMYYSLLLTCKGLTVLAMLNICMDIGIITTKMFALCVLYSILATIIPSPLIRFLQIFDHFCAAQATPIRDEIHHILVLPIAPYLAAPTVTLGSWVSKMVDSSEVIAGKIVDDIEEEFLEFDKVNKTFDPDHTPSTLLLDPILGICTNRWHGMRNKDHFKVKVLLAPNLVNDITEYVKTGRIGDIEDDTQRPTDTLIIGYDETRESFNLINQLIDVEELKIVIYKGKRGHDIVTANNLLLIQGSESPADDLFALDLCNAALKDNPAADLFIINLKDELKGQNINTDSGTNVVILDEFATEMSIDEVLSIEEKHNPFNRRIDIIICPIRVGSNFSHILKNIVPSIPICFVKANNNPV